MVSTKERDRLKEKFNLKDVSGGYYGEGFFTGLLLAEKYYEKENKK